jgi:MOSC domain-containing protein YiiM
MATLVGIYVADRAGAPLRSLQDATLVPGKGIEGDRYFASRGKFSPDVQDPDHEVTLIEIEQIRHFNAATGMGYGPEDLRRNLVTEGVKLNDLVGREFAVGGAVLRGIRLCEPCNYLAGMTDPQILTGLVHRAGLRAGIVRGATIRVLDTVQVRD